MCVSVCVWVRVWVCLGVSGCVSVSGCGLSECVCARMLVCARVMHVWQGVGRNTHESVSPRPSLTCCASSAEASRASQASPPSAPSPVSPLPAVCRHPPPRPAHGATAREDRAEGESPGALVAWHAMSTRPTHPDPHGIPCKVVGASSTLPVRACSNADRQQRLPRARSPRRRAPWENSAPSSVLYLPASVGSSGMRRLNGERKDGTSTRLGGAVSRRCCASPHPPSPRVVVYQHGAIARGQVVRGADEQQPAAPILSLHVVIVNARATPAPRPWARSHDTGLRGQPSAK